MPGGDGSNTEEIVTNLLTAIESRDLRAISSCLSVDATWQNVPSPAAIGRTGVLEMLAGILSWSDQVRWDVVSAGYGETECWLERADRFWIDGDEHVVLCNGVFSVDSSAGVVTGVRDYVDLGEWRARMAPVFERLALRSAEAVVSRHLAGVRRLDVVSMAADYGLDAELIRDGTVRRGWFEIVDYFNDVPERLTGRELTMSEPRQLADGTVDVAWHVCDGADVVAEGRDNYRVASGRIVRQEVTIIGRDF